MSVTGPDLDDEFDEDEFVEEFGGDEPAAPWHNSTRAVVGASAAGVAVIAALVAAVIWVTGEDESTDAPIDFVDPSFSATASQTTTSATTTPTITSTAQVSTTEINGPPPPPTSSDTSGSSTTAAANRRLLGPSAPGKTTRVVRPLATGDRASTSPARCSPDRSAEQPLRLLSVPVARYGPPDDPNYYSDDEPTAYAANYGGDYGGYGQPAGQPPGEPPEPPVPWYRKPAALVAFGAIIALMLALIVWLVVSLMSDSSDSTETTSTTTTTETTAPEVAPTQTVTETTPPSTSTETTTPSTSTETTESSTSVSTSTSTSTVTETVSPPPSNPQVPQIPQIPQIPLPGG